MSGGHFDYVDFRLSDISTEIEELIKSNEDDSVNEWGDTVGRFYSPETIYEFKLAVKLLDAARIYAHRIDYLVSGDDGEESFMNNLNDDLREESLLEFVNKVAELC